MTLRESKARTDRRGTRGSTKRYKHSSSTVKSTASEAMPKARQPRQPVSEVEQTGPAKVRADYRAVRAAKEGKKYINVLIDEELQLEVRPRMMLRKLTWETLIEGLLQKWLKANPKFHP